jgi:competence protein ComEC
MRSTKDERLKLIKWLKVLNPSIIIACLAFIALAVIASLSVPDGRLHVSFLDVGAGDAVLIRTPRGRQILVDGGKEGARTLTQIGNHLPFFDRSLDMVILTSPDIERLAGLIHVLERYKVDYVITGAETSSNEFFTEWMRLLMERKNSELAAPAFVAESGESWLLEDDVVLEILWPSDAEYGPLILRISYGNTKILLPGDATTLVEEALALQYGQDIQSTVLLVPRHGASTAAIPEFLQAVNPEIAVVTGDRTVSSYVQARLADIPLYQTAKHGSVTCICNGKTLKVRTTRD